MGKQVVGLKIGASSLTAARVDVNGSTRVAQVAREPLPEGLVGAGEVRDVEGLAQALKSFFAKHKLPRRAVRLGIATNRIGVRTIELAGIGDAKQLANAVRFRAQEALPIPLEEAVLDFQVLDEGVNGEGLPTRRVLLVVAYRDLVDAYARACRLAGVRLAGVDLEAFALLRALAPGAQAQAGERSALVAVSVGSERSVLAVSDGFTCEFTRVLDWGGAALTRSLASGLGMELDRAEELKARLSLANDGFEPLDGMTPEQAAQAREHLRAGLQGFARELVSSLQYYQSQPDSLGIREIVLAGGTARLGGLAETLEGLVGVSVRVGDPLAGVAVSKKVQGADNPALAVPIGLGMGR